MIYSNRLYFANNPIVINKKVTSVADSVEISISELLTGKFASVKLYPRDSRIIYDISYLISCFFEKSELKVNDFGVGWIALNQILKLSVNIDQNYNSRTFRENIQINAIRGGRKDDSINVYEAENRNLNITSKIPFWNGYPLINSQVRTVGGNQQVAIYNTAVIDLIQPLNIRSCNPIYLIFQNHLGGYSAWLFDDYEEEVKSSGTEKMSSGYDFERKKTTWKTTGNEISNKLTVRGKVDKKWFAIMEDLSISQDVYILEKNYFIKIINQGNGFSIPISKNVMEFSFSFEIPLAYENQKSW